MTPQERSALAALRFDVAPTPEDIWQPSPFNVPELHADVVDEIFRGLEAARASSSAASPLGVIVEGRAGSGKTHLLGAVREAIQRASEGGGGYFFLVKVVSGRTFWENAAMGMVHGLTQKTGPWGMQLTTLLRRLSPMLGVPAEVRDAVAGNAPLTRAHLDAFITGLRHHTGDRGAAYLDTARALVLLAATDYSLQDIGYAHLVSVPGEPADRLAWGMSAGFRNAREIVEDISRVIAITKAPSVIAVDQLDTMFAQSNAAFTVTGDEYTADDASAVGVVADSLLALRDATLRTLIVVTVLPDVLVLLKKHAATPVLDRFGQIVVPDHIGSAAIAEKIIATRFAARFAERHFTPGYPTWPVLPSAFADAVRYSPRALLRRVNDHVTQCLRSSEVVELGRLDEPTTVVEVPPREDPRDVFEAIDQRFAELIKAADVSGALDHTTEDAEIPGLLTAGFACWIDEQAPTGTTYKYDAQPSTKPALHGRLVEVIDEHTENEAHWAFRAIGSSHAVAVISRVKAACTAAGLDLAVPGRRLALLRRGAWPTGPRTKEVLDAFRQAGGVDHQLDPDDLRVFAALRTLRAEAPSALGEWLARTRKASSTKLFSEVLGERAVTPEQPSVTVTREQPTAQPEPEPVPDGATIPLGRLADTGARLRLNLESLRRHTVVFAGSGSGKTVLIRRLVEECALAGVSSIVLDPNNDLARLGEAWPQPPAGWGDGDAERAREYLDATDVVIWTPRVSAGRPLTFQPLPDFGPLLGSRDEFEAAIEAAIAALAPRARVDGTTKLADQARAVMREALEWYARSAGRKTLRGFADLLSDLPDEMTQFAKGHKLAHDAGETLKAAMVNDPLFGGEGTALDPGVLLTPAAGKRARISVISFVGLTTDEQRQSFVNQLQMALFAWIKRHPAGDRPLGGLFVMDEAQTLAPSTGNTPCTASSIALASQARKYGLGLVFATQAPKGLHNQISGNATTQFFGLLNAPAQIEAARELALAKGGRLPDIGLLASGQFYAAGEGLSFVKAHTPLCLSHHPKAPLAPEEVIDRAR